MSRSLRVTTMTVCALLWLSGCLWMVLHYFFQVDTDFGAGTNPWEPFTVRVHGILAICTVFLLGWIAARHISEAWKLRRNHVSGIVLSIGCALLVLSGYALYYIANDVVRADSALVHQILGAAAIVLALVHWHRASRSRSSPADGQAPAQSKL